MLVDFPKFRWWYMEIPRTGSTTVDRSLRQVFPDARAPYQKHWPVTPDLDDLASKWRHGAAIADAVSLISIRNPYSRAVSCWQFFTRPNSVSFVQWLEDRLEHDFMDINIEARPQSYWWQLRPKWSIPIRQEKLEDDFWTAVNFIDRNIPRFKLHRWNDINGAWVNRVQAKTSRDRPWQDYYCDRSKHLVQCVYNEDFACLSPFYSKEFPGELVEHKLDAG